mmetsp:Transcript_5238/g.9608  ORF Transcript_5238/g.9608 Transcript_5238/m.9608 type:complete len:267 (-) Transcript_5238:404-1204(-)
MKTQRNSTFIDTLLAAIDDSEHNSQTKEILYDVVNDNLESMGGKIDPNALTEALGNYVDVKKLLSQAKGGKKRLKSVDEAEGTPAKRRTKSSLLNQEGVTLLLNNLMTCRGLVAAPDLMEFMQRLMTEIYMKMINRTNFLVGNRLKQEPPSVPFKESTNPRKVLRNLEEQEKQLRDQIAIDELKDARISRRRRNKEEDTYAEDMEDMQEAVQSFDWRGTKQAQFDTALELKTENHRRFTLRDVATMLQTDMQSLSCFFKPKLAELL